MIFFLGLLKKKLCGHIRTASQVPTIINVLEQNKKKVYPAHPSFIEGCKGATFSRACYLSQDKNVKNCSFVCLCIFQQFVLNNIFTLEI